MRSLHDPSGFFVWAGALRKGDIFRSQIRWGRLTKSLAKESMVRLDIVTDAGDDVWTFPLIERVELSRETLDEYKGRLPENQPELTRRHRLALEGVYVPCRKCSTLLGIKHRYLTLDGRYEVRCVPCVQGNKSVPVEGRGPVEAFDHWNILQWKDL